MLEAAGRVCSVTDMGNFLIRRQLNANRLLYATGYSEARLCLKGERLTAGAGASSLTVHLGTIFTHCLDYLTTGARFFVKCLTDSSKPIAIDELGDAT